VNASPPITSPPITSESEIITKLAYHSKANQLNAFIKKNNKTKSSFMKKIIETPNAPAPIGPYSQAVVFDDTLYTSGQIAIDPATGNLISGDIQNETEQVMKNIGAVLKAAGMDFKDVLKTSIFIKNMDDFQKINAVYGSFFDEATAPARETVEVARLPKDVNVEISVLARK